jgi:hypothetical protein
VNVYVRAGKRVVVENEPAYPNACKGRVTWRVVTEGYTFDRNGIDFGRRKPPRAECAASDGGRRYVCDFGTGAKDREPFKYWVHLQGKDGSTPKVDPSIILD